MGDADWRAELDGWLAPFLAVLGHRKRRSWAPAYLRGLLGPGERKSLQPMAAGLGLKGHDQLQHFVTSPAWDDAPLRRLLVEKADALVGAPDAVLVVDDTALPKKGERSVGVARQYCGCLGKRANCQVLVSLTLARGEVPVPVGSMLANAAWRRISWRLGTKGPLAAGFATLRVRPAEGEQLRGGWHLPGEEVWLIGEHRASGERKYYLANLPAETSLEELAALIKACW